MQILCHVKSEGKRRILTLKKKNKKKTTKKPYAHLYTFEEKKNALQKYKPFPLIDAILNFLHTCFELLK